MLNYIMLIGRLVADPEKSEVNSDSTCCNFRIAVDRRKKKDGSESKTDFFNCVAWNGTGDIVHKYYHKGDIIMIVGSMNLDQYMKDEEKRVAPVVNVREIHFTGGRKHEEPEPVFIEGISDVDLEKFDRIFEGLDVPF